MYGKLLERKEESHKGDYGKIGIIAASRGMTGAAYLSCQAALRTGSGLVYNLVPESLELIMSIKLTEAIVKPIYDKKLGHFVKESAEDIIKNIEKLDAIGLGPGMGTDEDRISLVRVIIEKTKIPIVIDADGLNSLAKDIDILQGKKGPIVITPHMGEMSRLINIDIEEIKNKSEYYAAYAAKKYKVIVVLKRHNTIVASPEGHIYINTTGNPGMATAGSGDVLTGIITSLIGQGLPLFESAKLGVYLHGLAGDMAANEKGQHGLIASDIVEFIPNAILKVRKKSEPGTSQKVHN